MGSIIENRNIVLLLKKNYARIINIENKNKNKEKEE